jgi:hypothetical protein
LKLFEGLSSDLCQGLDDDFLLLEGLDDNRIDHVTELFLLRPDEELIDELNL